MDTPPGSILPAALLRLWLLVELGMAGLYGAQAWALWPYPADWAPPPIPRAVPVLEGLYLFLFVPAAIIIVQIWRRTRDLRLAVLALLYGLLSAASLAAWAAAGTLGMVRGLYVADALISLAGVPLALKALTLQR